jgi:hypothetical protein
MQRQISGSTRFSPGPQLQSISFSFQIDFVQLHACYDRAAGYKDCLPCIYARIKNHWALPSPHALYVEGNAGEPLVVPNLNLRLMVIGDGCRIYSILTDEHVREGSGCYPRGLRVDRGRRGVGTLFPPAFLSQCHKLHGYVLG